MASASRERRRDLASCGISVGRFFGQPQRAQARYFSGCGVLLFLGWRPDFYMYMFYHLEVALFLVSALSAAWRYSVPPVN